MGKRWIDEEVNAIAEVRQRLKEEIAKSLPFPDVIGDRRILRFLRGKQLNVDEASAMFGDFLQWRRDNNVDFIRQDILFGGKTSPFKFPFGKKIIDLAPQIIITRNAMDKKGQPLAMEQYDFSPKEVFKAVSKEDYLTFLTYSLEYRALVMEQLSHEREMEYIRNNPKPEDRIDGYGVMLLDFTIRDLKGIGMAHLGSDGRALVKAALGLGLSNYPEYLGKSHMINVPWIFNSMWYFVKGMLDEFTLAKINLCGSDYMDALLEDVPFDSIPERLGGGFKQYNEDFDFDLSPNGPFYYEGMEKDLLSLGINKSAKIKSNPVGSQKPVTTNVDSKLVLEPPATKSIPIATKKEAKTLNESETLGFSTFLQLSIKLYPLELLFCIMLLVIIGLASPPLGILATLLIALIYAIVKLI